MAYLGMGPGAWVAQGEQHQIDALTRARLGSCFITNQPCLDLITTSLFSFFLYCQVFSTHFETQTNFSHSFIIILKPSSALDATAARYRRLKAVIMQHSSD